MSKKYVVRDDEVDLNQSISWAGVLAVENERLALLCKSHRMELNNIIDFILYGHPYSAVIIYTNNLRHRLEEK